MDNTNATNTINASKKLLGQILIDRGFINEDQLEKALNIQTKTSEKLAEILLSQTYITKGQMLRVLESELGIKSCFIPRCNIDSVAVHMIPEELCRKFTLVGIEVSENELMVAMSDPLNQTALEALKFAVNIPIKPLLSTSIDIKQALDRYFIGMSPAATNKDGNLSISRLNLASLSPLASLNINNPTVIKLIQLIIDFAIKNFVSSICIEPTENDISVKISVNDNVNEILRIPLNVGNAVIETIKKMSESYFVPQSTTTDNHSFQGDEVSGTTHKIKTSFIEGKINMLVDEKHINLKVVALKSAYGESLTIRITDKSHPILQKTELGFTKDDLIKFDNIISQSGGMILVAGPSESGKTSTMYTILNTISDITKNILSLEDCVEYNLTGVTQVELNLNFGLTYFTGITSIMKQDPDVIMLTEVNDLKTAELFVTSALTGHLAIGGIHTTSAIACLNKLINLGIEPFLIASSLIGIISQRLVKKLCVHCKKIHTPNDNEIELLNITKNSEQKIFNSSGCEICGGSGYKGNIPIFEILEINQTSRLAIKSKASSQTLKDIAIKHGMIPLTESCRRLVLNGDTSIDELKNIVLSYNID